MAPAWRIPGPALARDPQRQATTSAGESERALSLHEMVGLCPATEVVMMHHRQTPVTFLDKKIAVRAPEMSYLGLHESVREPMSSPESAARCEAPSKTHTLISKFRLIQKIAILHCETHLNDPYWNLMRFRYDRANPS